jgi:hypothetical protein
MIIGVRATRFFFLYHRTEHDSLPYRKSASAGMSHDKCGAEDSDKRNVLCIHSQFIVLSFVTVTKETHTTFGRSPEKKTT